MKLLPFKELIALTKEKMNEKLAPVRARAVRAKAQLAMSDIDTKLLALETKIQEMCSDKDINLENLMDELDAVAILERRKDQYIDVLNQLFPAENAE